MTNLKIILSYKVTNVRQHNMFSGRMQNISTPSGEVHIFQMIETMDGKEKIIEPSPYAMCGKTRSEIGERTKDAGKRPLGLPMCSVCETKWKEHPDSPWKAWKEAAT